ncbi:hypothetical protein IB286_01910 [Spongiibacter sp. KMU-158]|uniref:Uncharacterized protein n=1 Tax=Spongiibacter pelagi TaxID=2760804 RepID=A0A927BY75_9GAMM|nr:hypothetical protein [Spongiibacter pelagi]MBD2857744.1 hypothetical protein [Spongiibacter pelagi]
MKAKSGLIATLAAGVLSAASGASFAEEDQRASFEDGNYNYLGGFAVGYKYQEMEASTIRNAYVKTVGLNIISLEWFPEQASWMQNISWMAAVRPKLAYEFTPGDSADQDEIAKASDSEKEGWTRFVADLDVDVVRLFKGTDEPSGGYMTFDYEVQSFLVTVQATQDYYYRDDNSAKLLTAGDKLDVNTTFTDWAIGYEMGDEKGHVGMGYFSVDYEKPISSDVNTPIETIYKANFEADGLFFLVGGEIGGVSMDLRYDFTFDATAEVDNGTSLTRSSFGYDESIEYNAYTLNASYDLMNTRFKLPVVVGMNYIQREFSNFTGGGTINDDKIFGLSVIGSFSL